VRLYDILINERLNPNEKRELTKCSLTDELFEYYSTICQFAFDYRSKKDISLRARRRNVIAHLINHE
jgi:hypothetical protein